MKEPAWSGNESLPLSVAQRVDAACNRFERMWQEGGRPAIEDFLAELPEGERPALLRELITVDADFRFQAGEEPRPEDYQARFPELDSAWLARVLALRHKQPAQSVDPAGGMQTRRLRCPHCHSPIQLADSQGDTVLCPGCGSSFHVRDARQTATQAMRQAGKFQLLERVGLGAFGAVWKARDTELDRIVALKIPHTGLLISDTDLERFHREARAAAQLRHPGVVTVHEVQTLEGLPTIVADFIHGITLRDLLESRRLTFREAATLIAEVAETLDYAHEMGLVHRDLKPANIMIEAPRPRIGDDGAPGEEAVAEPDRVGRPLVMDFGLALRDEAETTMTTDGLVLGTPAYMSPEQAAGYSHRADRRSDVYSLGVILYELLTGELPFRGNARLIIYHVQHEEPRPLRQLNDKVPRDLETVCLKALAKAPGRRYQRAGELAEELRRYLRGEPVQARPSGRLERGWLWCRRNPTVAALVASLVLALVGGATTSAVFAVLSEQRARDEAAARLKATTEWQRAEQESERARQENVEVSRQRNRAEWLAYSGQVLLAQHEWQDDDTLSALAYLRSTREDFRGWEFYYLSTLFAENHKALKGHSEAVSGLSFSPDGKLLASASRDGTIRIWDPARGEPIRTISGFPQQGPINALACSPKSGTLVTASADGAIRLWIAAHGGNLSTVKAPEHRPRIVAFSPDGRRIASGGEDGVLRVWALNHGSVKSVMALEGHKRPVRGVAYSPNGQRLASASDDATVRVWDAASGKELVTLSHPGGVLAVTYSPDGRHLASTCVAGAIRIWDVSAGRALLTLSGHARPVRSVVYSPDGQRLASASEDETVRIWDATSGKELATLRHPGGALAVAYSPDGRRLASASASGTIRIWAPPRRPRPTLLKARGAWPMLLALSADGRWLAVGERDQTLRILDTDSGREIQAISPAGVVVSAAFNPDGRQLAIGRKDGAVCLWDIAKGQQLCTLLGHGRAVGLLAYSPDGRRLASGSEDKTVRIWDMDQGQSMFTLNHPERVRSLAYGPDGKGLATASGKAIRVWDLSAGREALTIEQSQSPSCVAYSRDGERLASNSVGGQVQVHDAVTGKRLLSIDHPGRVVKASFSPCDQRLISGSIEGMLYIWEADGGQHLLTLKGHTQTITSILFSRRGDCLVTGSSDGMLRIWRADLSLPNSN